MNSVGRMVFAVLAVVAATTLFLRVGDGVETDLLGLADFGGAELLKEVASSSSRQGRVLLEGPIGTDFSPYVEKTLAALGQRRPGPFRDTLEVLAVKGTGLLSDRVRAQLLASRYGEVEADALARLFGPVPPLFSVKVDPFTFIADYVCSLETAQTSGWTLKEGYPCREHEGRLYELVTVDLATVEPRLIADFLNEVETMKFPVRIWCGGPAFHAAVTSEKAKGEVNCLSALSVTAVLVIGLVLLRSFVFIPRLLCALGVAALLAAGALFGFFPRPHVLTFVFGTSLIGLSVDYVYHACAAGDVRKIRRPITLAMITTVAAFVPLMFAAVNVLRQMALFTTVGLMAAWGWVLFADWRMKPLGHRGEEVSTPISTMHPHFMQLLLAVGVLLASAWELPRLRLADNPELFYCPIPYLAESERILAELCPENAGRFVYVKGQTLQEALEHEEAEGVKGLSAIIPSLKRQCENRALVGKFAESVGNDYFTKTGIVLPKGILDGDDGDESLLDPEKVDDSRLKGLVRAMWTGNGLVSPCPRGFAPCSSNVVVLEPKRALEDMFKSFTSATCKLLWWSLGVLLALLALFFRRRFLAHAIPLAATLMATAGTLVLMGVEITFFTLLCFFVLVGLGVDYVIFHQGGNSPIMRRTVFCSFLTSFIGLGALGFTGFRVTASMGMTFAIGLFYAWFFAWSCSRGRFDKKVCSPPSQAWYEQDEQSAGAWRIGIMWLIYRLFGKDVLKIVCVPVMLFIYPFAMPARKALAEFRAALSEYLRKCGERKVVLPSAFMHLLGFAWSLVDKTDVCTLRKSPPYVGVREDEGFHAFAEFVKNGRGAFLISSHLGTVEVLPALMDSSAVKGLPRPLLHAFQQLGHDAEFTRMFVGNFGDAGFKLHAVEEIGVETAVAMQSAVERGELVLMAGDRVSAGSGKVMKHDFLGCSCVWPKGVFAFALLVEAPVFFVTCVNVGHNRYEVHFSEWKDVAVTERSEVKRLRLESLVDAYVDFLEAETLDYPGQWYQFYSFFKGN